MVALLHFTSEVCNGGLASCGPKVGWLQQVGFVASIEEVVEAPFLRGSLGAKGGDVEISLNSQDL